MTVTSPVSGPKKIKKIMMVIPPNIIEKNSIRRIGEPIGPLMLASYLKEQGFDVHVYDMTLEGYDNCQPAGDYIIYGSSGSDLKERLAREKPDLVGLSCMFSTKEALTLEMARAVKDFDPSIVVAIGGIAPTIDPKSYLQTDAVDYVVMHDGEMRLERLINNLNSARPAEEGLDGLAWRQSGQVIIAHNSGNEKLSRIGRPDRSLVDMEGYLKIAKPFAPYNEGRRTAHVVTSRGCPFKCIFCCVSGFTGSQSMFRIADDIVAEITELVEKYHIEEIQFLDENLTLNRKNALTLFKLMKPFKLKWCTPSGLFFNSLDDELLEAMAASGCYQITLAIESASPRVLKDVIGKDVRLERVRAVVDKAHSLGLYVHGLFVLGLPGETLEEMKQTLQFPFENNFDSASFSAANALKGSRLFDLCLEKNYQILNSTAVNFRATNYLIPPDSPDFVMGKAEFEEMLNKASEEFFNWSRKQFPEIYARKYKHFIAKSAEDADKVTRRI